MCYQKMKINGPCKPIHLWIETELKSTPDSSNITTTTTLVSHLNIMPPRPDNY